MNACTNNNANACIIVNSAACTALPEVSAVNCPSRQLSEEFANVNFCKVKEHLPLRLHLLRFSSTAKSEVTEGCVLFIYIYINKYLF